MLDDVEDLKRRLEEQIGFMLHIPHGPSYRSRRKNLAKIYLESNRELEGIFHLAESHAVSLRSRTCTKYDQARFDEKKSNIVLDGSLVQHGGEYECKGVPSMLERLYELPEEWSVVQLTCAYDPGERFSSSASPFKHLNAPALHVTRFECGKYAATRPPYCITIPIHQKFQTLEEDLHTIIDYNERIIEWDCLSNEQFLRTKDMLDSKMRSVVTRLQSDWLGHWVSLLIGHYAEPELEEQVVSSVDQLLEEIAEGGDNSLHRQRNAVTARSRKNMYLLTKASTFLSEWELHRGIADCLEVPDATTKDLACQLSKFSDSLALQTGRRHPVILIPDEELELFPWEMLTVLQDHPVYRMPNLHMLYALYKAHEKNITGGRLQVDAEFGYYIVNPEQNLPDNEKRLRPFLTSRAPNWEGTFGVAPSSEKFRDVLQNYNIFMYAGHGSGSQFLHGDDIKKINVRAVTFLFGCSSVTSKDLGGRVEHTGIWHFYLTACCPMVMGNLWSVSDTASDAITSHILHNWLPATEEIVKDEQQESISGNSHESKDPDAPALCSSGSHKWKHEPDLLYAFNRSHNCTSHYMATAALVARGLPVVIKGKVDKNTVAQH